MDEGKGHAECVGDGGCTLGTSSVRGNYDSLLVVGYVELDVFAEEMAAIKVINRDVKEALVLGVWITVSVISLAFSNYTYREDPW